MGSHEIFALRKLRRSEDALEMARAEFAQNASDIWFLRAYAWVLYDLVKELVEAYEANRLSPTALSSRLSPYMREFSRMAEPLRGDSSFSQMIRLACKVSKDWQDFLLFARWAGLDDFSCEDEEPFLNEQGKAIDSLQTRFTRAICRETAVNAADSSVAPELIEWGMSILERALEADPSDQWLNYYQSKVHLARGELDQALKRLRPVLLRQSRAAWTWALLGEIFEPTRPDDALVCYGYAVEVSKDDQEVAKVRIQLAQRLAQVGRYNEAAYQVRAAQQYRMSRKYKIPQALQALLASDWYQRTMADDGFQTLRPMASAAQTLQQELGRQNLTYTCGVIDHVNNEKALSYVAISSNTGLGLSHRQFPDVATLPPGTLVEVGQAEPGGPPFAWRLSEDQTLPGLCEMFSGTLKRLDGKEFAFIRCARTDIFVPPVLTSVFIASQLYEVTCLAVWRTNKQGKTGWRAVKIFQPNGLPPSFMP